MVRRNVFKQTLGEAAAGDQTMVAGSRVADGPVRSEAAGPTVHVEDQIQ